MPKPEPITIDKTELILVPIGGGGTVLNVTFDKIVRIEIKKAEETKLFKKIPTEQIVFTIRGQEEPVAFLRTKVGDEKFETYKAGLARFAKDNRLTFTNSL